LNSFTHSECCYILPSPLLTSPCFAAPEADGYILTMASRIDKMLTCILILDSAKIEEGPVAIIELPFRLRLGIHGSWVGGDQFAERKELCDMEGVTDEVLREFQTAPVTLPDVPRRPAIQYPGPPPGFDGQPPDFNGLPPAGFSGPPPPGFKGPQPGVNGHHAPATNGS